MKAGQVVYMGPAEPRHATPRAGTTTRTGMQWPPGKLRDYFAAIKRPIADKDIADVVGA